MIFIIFVRDTVEDGITDQKALIKIGSWFSKVNLGAASRYLQQDFGKNHILEVPGIHDMRA